MMEASSFFSSWWAGLVVLMTALSLAVNIWHRTRPDPPLRNQFAAKDHGHAEYAAREHTHAADRAEMEERLNAIEARISAGFAAQERNNEDRSRRTHQRIDGLVEPLNRMIGSYDNHVREHIQSGGK